MANPPAAATGREPRTTGGRGLRGAAERAALLGGSVEAGRVPATGPAPGPELWRLRAVLPLGGGER
jgi:hypothetical protein